MTMCFVLFAILFALQGAAFFLIARMARCHDDRRARMPSPPTQLAPPPVASLSAVVQSREFAEAVRAHVRLALESGASQPAVARDGGAPVETKGKSPAPPPPGALTEQEAGLLAHLLAVVEQRIAAADAESADGSIFLPALNSQFRQEYTRETCEGLARKLVSLTGGDDLPLLAAGAFIRIRNLREGITAVDVDPKAAAPLRARFLT